MARRNPGACAPRLRAWRVRLRTHGGLLAATAAALLAVTSRAGADDPTPDAGSPAPTDVRTISGTVGSVSPEEHVLSIDTETGPVKLQFDRNTSVFLPTRLGTVLDLRVGLPVRASFGAAHRAYWIELRSPPPRERAGTAEGGTARRTDAGPPVLPARPDGGSRPSG